MPVWENHVSTEARAPTETVRSNVSVCQHTGETSVRPVSTFASVICVKQVGEVNYNSLCSIKPVGTSEKTLLLCRLLPLWCFQMWSDASQAGISSRVSATDTSASAWAGRWRSSTVACWELTWCPSWPLRSRVTSTVGSDRHWFTLYERFTCPVE